MEGFACGSTIGHGWGLGSKMPGIDDEEGARVPDGLPPIVDTHVHAFPDKVFESLWRWFEDHAWPIRYRLYAEGVIDFLLARGVSHVVLLHYAHRAGMARDLNRFVAGLASGRSGVTGVATVMPGEEGAYDVLAEGFRAGLRGVKLHTHVQCVAIDDPAMEEVFAACEDHDMPLVVHAGREPASPAYRCDPYALCHVDRVARVLAAHPRLRLCVPHLGADEFEGYRALLRRHDNLWLDTTMAVAGFFGVDPPADLLRERPDRVLYGTDFPNLPYAWDRELHRLVASGLSDQALENLLGGNARALWRL